MRPPALTVLAPHALHLALDVIAAQFEKAHDQPVCFRYGPATGTAEAAITRRLDRGEEADLVLLPDGLLDEQQRLGRVRAEGREEVFKLGIGMCVRAGATLPDVSSSEALTATLLAANSIAYSAAGSGDYVCNVLFVRLGIDQAMRSKGRRIEGESVAAVVARGEAEIGFQQLCELLPEPGVVVLPHFPEALQKRTVISAAVAVQTTREKAALRLIQQLLSPQAAAALSAAGMDPASQSNRDIT